MTLRDGTMMFFYKDCLSDVHKSADNHWYITVEHSGFIQQTEAHPTRKAAEQEASEIIDNILGQLEEWNDDLFLQEMLEAEEG